MITQHNPSVLVQEVGLPVLVRGVARGAGRGLAPMVPIFAL